MSILDTIKKAVMEEDMVVAPPLPHNTVVAGQSPIPVAWQPQAPPSTQTWMGSPVVAAQAVAAAAPPQADVAALTAKVHPKTGPLIQFLTMMESVAEYIPDEGQRFHAAEKALAKQSVDRSMILAEVSAAISRTDNEAANFEAVKQKKVGEEVTARESVLADIQRQIQGYESQLKDLTSRREETAIALTTAKAKIAERSEQFAGTVRAVKSQYDDLTRKINLYLVGGQSK